MTGAAFPPGVFIGAFGPPADSKTGLAWSALNTFGGPSVTTHQGGNPDVMPFLDAKKWPAMPPLAHEEGWKDTVIMYPGEVTRILVRWAPTDKSTTAPAADLHFPFDPNGGHGFVWHCHIIDHEDNEMMRPDAVMIFRLSGAATNSSPGPILEDTTKDFGAAGVQTGMTVKNLTDGSQGVITAFTATTITWVKAEQMCYNIPTT